MDVVKGTWKTNFVLKAWERCRSLGASSSKKSRRDFNGSICNTLPKSKACYSSTIRSSTASSEEESSGGNNKRNQKFQVTPEGCFSVYVGSQKQRFVVKTEFANHPLFQMLLEDAELEYGFCSEGPLLLPCDVDLFYKVLAEMDSGDEICTTPTWRALILCSPARCTNNSITKSSSKGYGAYRLLSSSRLLKLNKL